MNAFQIKATQLSLSRLINATAQTVTLRQHSRHVTKISGVGFLASSTKNDEKTVSLANRVMYRA